MVRRIVLAVCLIVVLDSLFLVLWTRYYSGWPYVATENVVSALFGVAVILYYEWRWSALVAHSLDTPPPFPAPTNGRFDRSEKMLLVVAGVFLILPGLVTDLIGLLLLAPPIRRWAACRLRSSHQAD